MMYVGNGRVENNEKDMVPELKKPIGVKVSDKMEMGTKFTAAMNSSVANTEPVAVESPVVEAVPVMSESLEAEPAVESPVESAVEVQAPVVEPVSPVMPEATVVSEPAPVTETVVPSVEEKAEEAKNIFDQMVEATPVVSEGHVEVPEVAIPGMKANVFDNPAVAPVTPVIQEAPAMNDVENNKVSLNTPQDLYQAVTEPVATETPAFEMPTVPTVENEPVVETPVQEIAPVAPVMPEVESTVSEENVVAEETREVENKPYVVYLENIKKTIEDKDTIIDVLKQKNEVLIRENERLNNELKIANERMTIAEGARQEAFSQAAPEASRVLTPETNINMAA